ncbi:MAG: hypothetical protein AAGB24_04325 [Bacteroidota bacterium]
MRKRIVLFLMGCTVMGCGSDDGPPPSPEAALLVFPFENSECTTGLDVNEDLSRVTFEWQSSANTDTYTLTVLNLNTNITQTIATAATAASLSIEKGAPFSWSVTSTNQRSNQTAVSEDWLFYNAGSQTNYAPFPAQIIAPKSGSTIAINELGQVQLAWSGTDVEDDIVQFEVYFSNENPPQDLLVSTDGSTFGAMANAMAGVVYYWRVVTVDGQGNTSDSGIFDFKVL